MAQYDVIVIGAGPAGLAAALYAGRALMKTVVLEEMMVGGQIAEAHEVDNYPGFPEGVGGAELGQRMADHIEKFGVELAYSGVRDIRLQGPLKRVITDDGEYVAPVVIVASGAAHRKLGVPGEERLAGRGVSYCGVCDGPFFRDKKLVVIGGGDAAMTESLFLARFASEILLIHRRQGFRARAANLEAARKSEKINFRLDTIVTEILGEEQVEGVTAKNVKTGEEARIDCDGVFIFIGQTPNTAFLATVLPEYAGKVVPVDFNMETDVKGIYAVGDVRKGSYRQVGTAVGDGITAALHVEQQEQGSRVMSQKKPSVPGS
ncbi:MAG: thioredoxin-disulfide reductase [Planctomycetes bacterium]|nr:thioredoxin-disulfide reductase [Planctomycetota bacterium]